MKIEVTEWSGLDPKEQKRRLRRSENDISRVQEAVQDIIREVRSCGDEALRRFTRKFDEIDTGETPLRVSADEMEAAAGKLNKTLKAAIDQGIDHVKRFHERQIPDEFTAPGTALPRESLRELTPGLLVGEMARPIPSVGLYVPRGKGSFPSMLYMLAVPAFMAGVPRIVVTTPPGPDGSVDPATLYTAARCGVHEIYRVGGAQAIAALAYGTESIVPVAKIEGPGSFYVSAARRLVSGDVDAGMPAGPSESIVLADGEADAETVVVDLLIEAEHGSDSSSLLITESRRLAEAAARILPEKIAALPVPRRTFVTDVITGYGGILLADSPEQAALIVNQFAPEHLMIHTADPWKTLPLIENAGEILLGTNTPFSAANYACGVNAVLPTGGRAATCSAISVRDFIKYSSIVEADRKGLSAIADTVITMADYEDFPAHAEGIRFRFPEKK